jgi:hypothetical protein
VRTKLPDDEKRLTYDGSNSTARTKARDDDLKAAARMLGTEFSAVIPRLPVGYSVFHLADVGDPLVLAWRPTYSQA